MPPIYIHYGADPAGMAYRLMEEARVAQRLSPGMRVIIKPNLVVSRPAHQGATTHPELVEGVIRFLQSNGIRSITIAEGAWVGDSTAKAFERCGYTRLARQYGVTLLDTKQDPTLPQNACGLTLQVCRSALEADFLINMPVLKGHCQTGMTCCLKNLKGCIPDSEKRRYHTLGLDSPIAALNTVLIPHLHIIDSICGDLTFEEGGNPVEAGRVLLGYDGLLLDSYCAGLLGFRPDEIGYLRRAREYGLGEFAGPGVPVVELGAEHKPAVLPQNSPIARQLGKYAKADGACSACYAALLFALHKTGVRPTEPLLIGQGYRGRALAGTGIGSCTAGCGRYLPGCPPRGIDVAEFLKKLP